MEMIDVVPAKDVVCPPHPIAGALPPEGATWPFDTYTRRRLRDGDIERAPVTEPAPAPAEASAPPPTPEKPADQAPAAAEIPASTDTTQKPDAGRPA